MIQIYSMLAGGTLMIMSVLTGVWAGDKIEARRQSRERHERAMGRPHYDHQREQRPAVWGVDPDASTGREPGDRRA